MKNYETSFKASSEISLGKVYHEKISILAKKISEAAEVDDPEQRTRLYSEASKIQSEADYIAHCLAYFGDKNISLILDDATLEKALILSCRLENPWSRGLYLLRQEFL